ncbi:TetR family transcriptional regulator [Rhodococcus gordoniae]|uniref:TetR family transcriptional regulator n=1 Tax=Rhodococcus gordoniae TaxID=223392 RepID=A0A379M0R2_9NOCA|nr:MULTISPECIES: TetR/AcrR family transcriptional regulator [Rhodococcus]SUE15877.1 TetR family transcriptional regulator [Rhodococcus gordoniae]
MAEVKRPYDASGRQAQARVRRRAVVVAAQELFERDGFRATTLAAVANRAGVSVKGLYKSFGSKAALAKAVFDVVIAGDDEPISVAERPEQQAMLAEPDVRRKIDMFTHALAHRQHRSAKVQILIRDGRHVDDSLDPVWQQLSEEGSAAATMVGAHLMATGQLRDDIELDEVRDVLWNYLMINTYEALVLERGWALDRYADWLARTVIASLCPQG